MFGIMLDGSLLTWPDGEVYKLKKDDVFDAASSIAKRHLGSRKVKIVRLKRFSEV